MPNINQPLRIMASVLTTASESILTTVRGSILTIVCGSLLTTACEQENLTFGSGPSSFSPTTITLTAQPPVSEEEIPLTLSTFGTKTFPKGPTDSDTLIHVTSIPAPCTLWQGHVVVLVEPITVPEASPSGIQATVPDVSPSGSQATVPEAFPSGSQATVPGASASGPYKEARITLLSKSEWSDLPSALNATNPSAALAIPTTYSEGTLRDWRIPTAAEAKIIKTTYTTSQSSGPILGGRAFESLNALLTSVEAPNLQATDEKGNTIRYLCEDATRSFSFAPGTTISAAGTKTTTYRLRLVKPLLFKLK